MDTVDLVFNFLFLVFGVVIVAGIGLIILLYKREHPEQDLNYKTSFVGCVIGILFIIGGITAILTLYFS